MRDVRGVLVHRFEFGLKRKGSVICESLVFLAIALFVCQIKSKHVNGIIVRSDDQGLEAELNVGDPLLGDFFFPEWFLLDHI
jgi:hypothetical protein